MGGDYFSMTEYKKLDGQIYECQAVDKRARLEDLREQKKMYQKALDNLNIEIDALQAL